MATAFCSWMIPDEEFVLSKGHAAAVLYACLAEVGKISPADCETFYHDGTLLPAHPPAGKLPGIAFATGSLGHGLSLAAGLALGNRLRGKEQERVFCLCSDGELDEGSTWEAILFSAHQRLGNLVCLIDRNHIQGFGRTEEVLRLEPLAAKFSAFGWEVIQVEGNSLSALFGLRDALKPRPDATPRVVIATTQKGHGMLTLQNTVDCHYLPLTNEDYDQLIKAIEEEAEGPRRA